MLASRSPASLHHRVVAGCQRRRCIAGKRPGAQSHRFTQALESLWSHSSEPSAPPAAAASIAEANPKWQPPQLENAAFEEYYKVQGIVSEEEWDAFMSVLRTPLPVTFRINTCRQYFKDIRSKFESDFRRSLESEVSNEYQEHAIRPLVWYPDNLAWHLNFSRKDLRKNQALESFHEFLKHESEVGNITRQEAVSMVPPLFLDVQPDHDILDMCAAPGSKTFQLLEMIQQSVEPGLLPGALVIANDINAERCDILIHNTKRICTANLVVTNHKAQNFPACSLAKDCSEAFNHAYEPRKLEFDRVLCDVPCSGDGTIRKGHDIWRKWNSGMGNENHRLQIDIAMHGIALLKVGGRMVYSTCSMNPVENEAVVAELLRRAGNCIELLDVSNKLPELVRRPGLITWKVQDRGSWFETYEDLPHNRKSIILPSMFPSSTQESHAICCKVEANIENNGGTLKNCNIEEIGNTSFNVAKSLDCSSDIKKSNFPLHRCMRIVPHDQNSGAFFIAVLHKVAPLNDSQIVDMAKLQHSLVTDRIMQLQKELEPEIRPSENILVHQHLIEVADDAELLESGQAESGDIMKKSRNQNKWKGVDPVLFLEDELVIESLVSFFGIKESFPLTGHLVIRSIQANNPRRIYYISKSVQEILQLNLKAGEQLKIASVGLRIFETHRSKDDCPCAYRLSYEGLPLLIPFITKRVLYASPVDFHRLLQYRTIKFAHFVDAGLGEEAAVLTPGCCAVVLRDEGHKNEDPLSMVPSTIAMVCWRGKGTMNVMLSPPDRKNLLEMMAYQFGLNGAKVEEEKPCHKIDGLHQGR